MHTPTSAARAVSPYFMFPGAQAALIAYAKEQIRDNTKRRVQRELVRVLARRGGRA